MRRKTCHGGGVGYDESVKSELLSEKSADKRLVDACRKHVAVGNIRLKIPRVCRLHDVSDHDGQRTRVYAVRINLAVACIPFLTGKRIDRRRNVLVALVNSVTGEMLDCRGNAVLLHFTDVRRTHSGNSLGVRAKRAHVGYRISPVVINIYYRRKRPVSARRRALHSAHLAKSAAVFRVVRRRYLHRLAE